MLPVTGFERFLVLYQSMGNGVEIQRVFRSSWDLDAVFAKERAAD
jgi:hypothetical protein